uniref:Uncharacterized protein n=1 Tax=Ixodes ricinus TaxID=34613 RepID=A0A6B0U409_IXORI
MLRALVLFLCRRFSVYTTYIFLHVLLLLLASTLSLLLHILFCVLQVLTGRCAGILHAPEIVTESLLRCESGCCV